MGKMNVVQLSKPGGDWELLEREIPEPGPGQVRIKIHACGICHGDMVVKDGHWPGLQYPRVPGHEVAGSIDAVGDGVPNWKTGQRAGVGWHGGHCFHCDACRRGDFIMCETGKITGISFDGGYAEYMIARAEALASIPDEMPLEEAGPLMCAGLTVFNALRHSGATPGDLVAIQGIGGLGHLGIQYARKMGFETVAIGRRQDKEALAKKLGAHHYIDYASADPVEELKKRGGARVVLATAPDSKAISALIGGLSRNGRLVAVSGSADPIAVNPWALIGGRDSISGWASGTAKDSEDTMRFSALAGIHPMIERYPLARVADAYRQMTSGNARFRAVLTMEA